MDSFERFAGGAAPRRYGVAAYAHSGGRRLAIVDPSRLRRDCLKLALGMQARRWHVSDVAAATDLARLVEQGDAFAVILLGGPTASHISLADLDLLSGVAPATPVLVAAECDDRARARAILRAGARGFLPTNLGLKVLVAALERIRAGGTYVPVVLTEAMPGSAFAERGTGPWDALTRRQREVLALVSQGLSNKLIAAALARSESTVKAHVKSIIRRLNVANRTQAALLAARVDAGPQRPRRAIVTA